MRNKTTAIKQGDIERKWHFFDAKELVLGRLSTEVARLLIGKDKVAYSPNLDCGDYVVVINSKHVAVTGNKETDKMYYRHSGYPGGFREERLEDVRARRPEKLIRDSVSGMLPKNKLRAQRLARLKIYDGATHPHRGQLEKTDK